MRVTSRLSPSCQFFFLYEVTQIAGVNKHSDQRKLALFKKLTAGSNKKKKNSAAPGIEPRFLRILVARSNH